MASGVAQQVDGHPDVVLRDAPGAGNIVAKVPNGQALLILQTYGDQMQVQWNAMQPPVQGWAKATNITITPAAPAPLSVQAPNSTPPAVDSTAAFMQQVDGHPDVVLRDAPGPGAVVAKVPNFQPVKILQQVGDQVQVQWNQGPGAGEVQGWAKVTNVRSGVPPGPGPSPGFVVDIDAAAVGGGAAAVPAGPVQLFTCNHHTDTVVGQYAAFVGPGCPWPMQAGCLRASMPPFNAREMTTVPSLVPYDLPVYGPDMTKAVLDIFVGEGIKDPMADFARKKNIRIPQFTINKVVMSKMSKVREMIAKIETEKGSRGTNELDVINMQALEKLSQFVDRIDTLHLSNVSDAKEWAQWLDTFFGTPTWKDTLHVKLVLQNFGFTPALAESIGEMTIGRGEKVSGYSIRWLAKAFEAFGLSGTIADVVNLVYAMTNQPSTEGGIKPERSEVLNVIANFANKLRNKQIGDLWVPTHLVHDSETDDMLTWLLLEYVHFLRGTQLQVLIQMPDDPELLGVCQSLQQRPMVQVFIDPKSRNKDPVKAYWQKEMASADTVYIVSRMEARGFAGQYKKTAPYEYTEVPQKEKVGLQPKILWRDADGFWQVSLGGRAGVNAKCSQLKALSKGEENPCQVQVNMWQLMTRARNEDVEKKIILLPEVWTPLRVESCAKDDVPVTITADPPKCKCTALAATDGLSHCPDHTRKVKFDASPAPVRRGCPYYAAALAFLDKAHIEDHLDHFNDRCFCVDCYPADLPDEDGGYIVPRGWVGFGLTIPQYVRNIPDFWKWPVSFHGTKFNLVGGILGHGHVGMPGDRLIDGKILEGANSAGRSDAGFYTSPTIRYAGLQMYAAATEFQYGSKNWGQVVLQCRQTGVPQTVVTEASPYGKKTETMGFLTPDGMYDQADGKKAHMTFFGKLGIPHDSETGYAPKHFVCPHTPLNVPNIEWFSNKPELCIPYRICVRVFPDGAPPDRKSAHQSAMHRGQAYETFRSPVDVAAGGDRGNGMIWL